MVKYCFEVILARCKNKPLPVCSIRIPDILIPIFVTWKIASTDELRGCIGNFTPLPLRAQLQNYACVAAFEDDRFSPIKLNEIPLLSCTVSLLHSFEPCAAWND
uniref:AMMECR1 domain-containing protein n=1 Tax=Lygus hesperus TaxID=30085 RepID=A0A0A9XVR6_LYGHE